MSADKRTVATDALETLGTIITENEKRDAIHLAVENVKAGERLYPGQSIGIGLNGLAVTTSSKIGIVDPFLERPVEVGERFWLVIFPRVITSLRHVWTHPDLPDEEGTESKIEDTSQKSKSEAWLRDFATKNELDFDWLISVTENGGEKFVSTGSLGIYADLNDEYYWHLEQYTGTHPEEEWRILGFSCAW